ncbi:Predicted metal-dependent phosphohydrolase, HD superfamily [Reichenbachiella faecimaris]|uniref:Predicted metal-dependent phosphohydrolase, HD superfamily n=1 Tax=Reichenbachiella faecimaris TaxID=692418 RepID=A0A1W2GCW5_REIFA|nr:Pycsar system effector family protein [Reichenbachiella faecimaris]SMD34497.1 Predicted metal-dependent phosphohydrolase, HD superfamily [Reichenbachiella faecimaris]
MATKTSVLAQVEEYVSSSLKKELPEHFLYHDLAHTQEVVKAVKLIAKGEGLNDEDLETLAIAAWFHDLGHIRDCDCHERKSAEIAQTFLEKKDFSKERIAQVEGCIMATMMPQRPLNLMQSILCDADLYHLSTDQFEPRSNLLRKEWEEIKEEEFKDSSWRKINVDFLGGHTYFTEYARKNFETGKQKNLLKLKEQISKGKKIRNAELKKKVASLEKKLEKAAAKENKPTRGIETMFRTTSKNHLDLSAMADNKANIMISINSIILSIIISVLIRKLEEYPHFIIPTLIMTVVCLVTIVLSILATRPNISKGKFTQSDIMNKRTNLLFFGNFHQMSLEEYEWGMNELMNDSNYLYGSLIKDIYYLGAVLGKKYKRLRVAYTVFMFGFVIAVLSFIVAEVFFKNQYMY